jgi:hypothetical protein
VLAILIGVGAGTLVTYVVLHEQARRDAFRNAALTVRQIVAMLQKARTGHVEWSVIQDMNDECAASLRKVQAALEEARREHWRPLDERDPMLARLPPGIRQLQMDALVVARAHAGSAPECYGKGTGACGQCTRGHAAWFPVDYPAL